ncbi:GNAT family N-acetyltransferase [Actibacterium ureilyticum]|uniref:GNAT family N-acetyltransferase n=1 Tax=Actibacterium ureilyticum TaxID=1590614 RepID=UPI000BAAE0D9|nr:GNAT family N-acetyltransferase [Actibacterium ureilyticum]
MSLTFRTLTGADIAAALDDLARLRIAVFRDWPYLYDGDLEYERRYLETYRDSADAILVAAFDGDRIVGMATGTRMKDHDEDFAAAFAGTDYPLDQIFYCAESVLMPDYRGQGAGHAFFDAREGQGRALGCRFAAFCGVVRPDGHPLRPAHYRPLDAFWQKRGYRKLEGVIAHFRWKDIDQTGETDHPLQFWIKPL